MLKAQTLNLLRRYDLRARKGLGQHFLIDSEALDKIIAAAEITSEWLAKSAVEHP